MPPPPTGGQPPPGPLPPATAVGQTPASVVLGPLVQAAEEDLAAGRAGLALARASVAIEALAEGEALRIRAEGLQLLAQRQVDEGAQPPPIDEVIAPMVAQAELDLRAGNASVGVPRLDFALARLPEGSPLRQRAVALRAQAQRARVAPPQPGGPTGYPGAVGQPYAPPPGAPYAQPPEEPRDPNQRGTGEAVEMYVTLGLFGALTGGWVPYISSNATAGTPVYALTMIGGAGLGVVGALALDLSAEPKSGVEPTISAGVRFGFASGMFAFGLYEALEPSPDANVAFTLVWSGAAAGAALGLTFGFGLEPEVREERFVESAGIWGAGLAGSIAMLTQFDDQATTMALGLAGINAGWIAGAITTAAGGEIGVGRTLFLDLGFLGGFGVGLVLPLFGYYVAMDTPDWIALGIGSLVGSLAGWSIMLGLTHGWSTEDGSRQPPADEPTVHVGISPVQNGAILGVDGTF